jgi:uncharacterized protein DUF1206
MIEPLARLGYASKAIVYGMIGVLALSAATRTGGVITDRSGALRAILARPLGNTLLFVLAIGLCGYALWRVLDALFDPDRHGTRFNGLVVRIGSIIRAIVYGALGVEAFRLAAGLRTSRGDATRFWAERILAWPFGEWILGVAGVIVAVYGISQVRQALVGHSHSKIDLSPIPVHMRDPLLKVGSFGIGARAVIIVVLGVFLVRAAIKHDPREAHGLREAIVDLVGFFEGRWVLIVIALGLIAYGIDQALHARCRRIRSPIR